MPKRRVAQFVVKISKYCNLRCAYCYEFAELANKHRMPLGTIGKIFTNIVSYVGGNSYESVSFLWHGGEPFMVPLHYYEAIGQIQAELFAEKVATWNTVQTNLTILTDDHLRFLQSERFFRDGLGISFDVYGDQRVDVRGNRKTDVVLRNLQKLIEHQIGVGAIAVLARNTLPHVREIYRFYDKLGIECQFLPFYRSASETQVDSHSITYSELVGALKAVFDEWFCSERATPVHPIGEYVDYVCAYVAGRTDDRYNKELDECDFIVNVDGSVWGIGEAYIPEYRYGNLVHESFGAILSSKGRALAIERAHHRLKEYCESCPYFGACPGNYVGDASPQQEDLLAKSGCPVRGVMDHMLGRIERAKLTDVLMQSRRRVKNEALSVAF